MVGIGAMIMTAGSLAILLRGLLAPRATNAPSGHSKNVYSDQMKQLEHEVAAGEIHENEAEAARIEIGRRLLAAAGEVAPTPRHKPLRRTAWGIAFLFPAAAAAIYLSNGRPALPSQPFSTRDQSSRVAFDVIAADAEALKQRLAAEPQDRDGWIELGRLWSQIGDPSDASDAYGHAISLRAGDSVLEDLYAEALVAASGGTVTKSARDAFGRALALKPDDITARYYMALANTQAGDDRAALGLWSALVRGAPANAPWLPSALKYLAETTQRLDLDSKTAAPSPQ
jgi:cytochrome c-type biogenesis protein CcmH